MKRISLAMLLLAVVVSGCFQPGLGMSPSPSAPSTLAGTSWRAVSVSGAVPVAGGEPTLVFAEDQVSGTTGCNQYFGGYTYADGAISLTNVGMTMMACDGPISATEAAFTQALNGATTVSIDDGGQLLLSGSGGEVLFKPDAAAAR